MVKKGIYILSGTVLLYGILVATHKGEFWPFSIYPMFSQAGNPWTRALVRDVSDGSTPVNWNDKTKQELPGNAFAMNEIGINQNDLANFISKTENWSDEQVNGLRKYFKGKLDKEQFLIFMVRGRLSEEKSDSVAITYIPYIYLSSDSTLFNPRLFESRSLKTGS